MLPFCKFQKIYESAQQYSGERSKWKDVEWTVQEKVHGSNFSIYFDPPPQISRECPDRPRGPSIRFAKRTGFLDFERDWFYGFQRLGDELRIAVTRVHEQLMRYEMAANSKERASSIASPRTPLADGGGDLNVHVIVYGELFGGFFPTASGVAGTEASSERVAAGPNWEAVLADRVDAKTGQCKVEIGCRAVQEGVYYSEKLSFVAFDVAYWVRPSTTPGLPGLEGQPLGGDSNCPQDRGHLKFLTSSEFDRLAADLNSPGDFRFARTLLRTRNYREVLDYDLDFSSTLAEECSAPAGGKCEAWTRPPGTTPCPRSRRPRKRNGAGAKSARAPGNVAEGLVARSDVVLNRHELEQGRAFVPVRLLVKRKHRRFREVQDIETQFSPADVKRDVRTPLARMVCLNRLDGVLSKTVGRLTAANRKEVVRLLKDDVLEDFYANPDLAGLCGAVETSDSAAYLEALCRECVDLAMQIPSVESKLVRM